MERYDGTTVEGIPIPGSQRLSFFPKPTIAMTKVSTVRPLGDDVSESRGYFRLFARRCRTRGTQMTARELDDMVKQYLARLSTLESHFGPFLSSYDKEVVLTNTVAMGMIKPLHFDFDEKGKFGVSRHFLFPRGVEEAVIADLFRKDCIGFSDDVLSMKRGTNLGWPTQKGGRSRDESDLLLLLHTAFTLGCKSRGLTLRQAQQLLEARFGVSYAIAGERYQHTERTIPFFIDGSEGYGMNVFCRCRGIYFSPKFMVAWNRPVVKALLRNFLRCEHHTQDRDELRKKFAAWGADRNRMTVSIDVSRFDQSMGGAAGRQALSILADLAQQSGLGKKEDVFANFDTEFSIHNLIPSHRGVFLTSGAEILSSGTSFTSLVGCTLSHMIAYQIAMSISGMDASNVRRRKGISWDFLSWGDDIVFSIDRNWARIVSWDDFHEKVVRAGTKMELRFDFEPTIKFLGQNYDMLSYSRDSDTGYPVGRFLQQQFFPERRKDYPFNLLGYYARLSLVSENRRNDLHNLIGKSHLLEFPIPWPVTYADLRQAAERVLPEVEQYAQSISQLDDVLGVYTHGMDPTDFNSDIPGELDQLLALASIDVSDPQATLASLNIKLPDITIFSKYLQALLRGEVWAFSSGVEFIARNYNSPIPMRGDSYY